MLLVIPSIDLCGDHCVREKDDSFERETVFFDDPVKMARLWRIQNARALNVAAHDAHNRCRRKVLREICEAVDIPIQLSGGLTSIEDVQSAFDAGVYRLVIDVDDEASHSLFAEAIAEFTPSRVIAGIMSGMSVSENQRSTDVLDLHGSIEVALRLERAGCRRFVYSDSSFHDLADESTTERIREFSRSLGSARVTVAHCIGGFSDLKQISELGDTRVDSAIVGRALYENRFPCQQSWCWNHKEDLDLEVVSTARLQSP